MTRDAPEGDGEWRRAALSYREKFVNDLVIALPDATGPPLRIAQAASAAAVGTASRRGDGQKDRQSVRRGAGPVLARVSNGTPFHALPQKFGIYNLKDYFLLYKRAAS